MRGVFTHRGPESSSEYGLGSRSSESYMTEPGLGVRSSDQKAIVRGGRQRRTEQPMRFITSHTPLRWPNPERCGYRNPGSQTGDAFEKPKLEKMGRKSRSSQFVHFRTRQTPRHQRQRQRRGGVAPRESKRASREGDPSVNHQTHPSLSPFRLVIARVPHRTPARERPGCRPGHPQRG